MLHEFLEHVFLLDRISRGVFPDSKDLSRPRSAVDKKRASTDGRPRKEIPDGGGVQYAARG